MKSNRKIAIIVGALIIIAYSVLASFFFESSIFVLFLELISGAASVAVGVLMFSILKPHNKNLALGYVFVKIIEGAVIIVASILLFSLIINRGTYEWIHEFHVYIFGAGFLILSYLLYKSKLVPRLISIWGLIASIVMLVSTLLNMTVLSTPIPMFISHLPIISNELFLAVWLIVRGFNPSAIVSGSAKESTNNIK
jgi:hypothetical protein